MSTGFPFLILALVYVIAGGRTAVAIPIFSAFVVARFLHSILYLNGRQPERSIAFAASALAIGALMVAIVVVLCFPSSPLL